LIVCGRSGWSARPRLSINGSPIPRAASIRRFSASFAVEVGLDVAARQFADGDCPEVRQLVDLKLAPHVSQTVRAQPLSDFALIVLISELRDGRQGTNRRSRRGGGVLTIRHTPSRGMRSGAVCPGPSLTAPISAACS
jgi:hypothetical protein